MLAGGVVLALIALQYGPSGALNLLLSGLLGVLYVVIPAVVLAVAEVLLVPGALEDNDETMQTTFGAAYERLQAVKDEWDPENVFSNNQNVKPSAETD